MGEGVGNGVFVQDKGWRRMEKESGEGDSTAGFGKSQVGSGREEERGGEELKSAD